ncbi:RagB/SusD family nutrient uptake outer membrane protein [uncultured Chitinophaga sp.]|uniref:RagB/SusD family nutrient uptake outer membrane protein n=1 Tax=uncultured Chitinophaga sp. TaxID=339340 RepID=UPI0025EE41F7|nr:RagB/SusD family nutrient uptake outer membrane protein [uncultured Chitinophaga sp.]
MKKIALIFTAALSLGLSSCSKYLDQVPDDVIVIEDIFKSRANTDKYLANVYSNLPNEIQERYTNTNRSGFFTGASDEARYTWDFPYSTVVNASTWSNTDGTINAYWQGYYRGIRDASYFIQHIDEANAIEVNAGVKKAYKAEARALRAIFYYFLVRQYGPVMILGEQPLDLNAPLSDLQFPRHSIDSCVNYIVRELDIATADLDEENAPFANEIGRVTRGAAQAFKIQALMLAASPLWNGNPDYATFVNKDGSALTNQTFDITKWQRAAAAAKSFIDQFVTTGRYRLYTETNADPFMAAYLSVRNVQTVEWNAEWIYARSKSGSYLRYDRTPKHVGLPASQQGAGALGATQTQVDAYFMRNGLPITDPASGYQTTGFSLFRAPYDVAAGRNTYNQWINREPRFYADITYNNSYWLFQESGSTIITNMEFSGNSGRTQSTSDVSSTGYIVRKAIPRVENTRGSLFIRVANIYLDYAEALNEGDYGNADVLVYLNLIRTRAGIPTYGAGAGQIAIPASQEAMREAIRAERRVELAFENWRFFDTRRWKIAETTNNGPIYGMNMFVNGNGFYDKTQVGVRVFRKERDYLMPIPQNETLLNTNLVQNPNW